MQDPEATASSRIEGSRFKGDAVGLGLSCKVIGSTVCLGWRRQAVNRAISVLMTFDMKERKRDGNGANGISNLQYKVMFRGHGAGWRGIGLIG